MFYFAEQTKDMTASEILNYYRNLYYAEPQVTERGIVANAINDVLPRMVEVVRCKDCKKRGQRDCIVNRKMACEDHETTTKANDFCSYGERKEDNC